MLTVKNISPQQGKFYYCQENNQSFQKGQAYSSWSGIGAQKLGLEGLVTKEDFNNLLSGCRTDGNRFRKKPTRQGYKECGGIDCTFSAPKSVSLLVLEKGDRALEQAHQLAVEKALKVLESRYAATRVRNSHGRHAISTENLVIAKFNHDIGRELDPHLHTHCVVLNATECGDKYYGLHNKLIYANKKLLGMIYQNELAIQVQKLGYEIEQKGNGQFELKGFTQSQLEYFSQRRQQIKSQLGEESTWKEREAVWAKTRVAKRKNIPRDALGGCWREEVENLGITYPQPDTESVQRPHPDVDKAVASAIAHLSERKVAFKVEDIQKFILADVGKYQHHEIEKAISTSNELIHLDKLVTTQSALMREIATIGIVKQGEGQVRAISTPKKVAAAISEQTLTEGQQKAIALAATTKDQFIAWQGKAGVGKTYALNEFKQIAQREGCIVKGFAPSAKAAKVLAEEMGIETTTVARKLVSKSSGEEIQQQQIWIVDEAGLLGAKDAYHLLQKASTENARVLLVGDTRQLSSVAAGNPFKSLQQAGIATAHLNQSLRQKTQDLKQAVDLLSDGKIAEGIDVFETNQRILEIKDGEERASHIAQDYLKLTPEERKQTLIIAGTHQERETILDSIREGLKQSGSLGEEVTAFRLKSKNLTNIQKNYAHYYEPGNIVVPLANYKKLGLEKGRQYRVKAVEGDSLVLTNHEGEEKKVSPTWFKFKEVYEAKKTNIAVGDRLRWGKNDKQLNRINGESFIVTQIEGRTATIESETGKRELIDLTIPQHLDHALVSTTYSSQGVTANRVLVSIKDDLTLSQEGFYVAASRAKYNLQLYVENKARLIEKAQNSHAQLNPLELIRGHQQKEAAISTATSEYFSEQQLNQTVQENHERNQSDQPVPRSDSHQSSDSSQPTPQQHRVEPKRVSQLAEGINRIVDEQRIQQRLTRGIGELEQNLRNRISSNSRTNNFGKSITRLDEAITKYTRKRKLRRVNNYVERSTLESDTKLITLVDKLDRALKTRSPDITKSIQNLQASLELHSQRLKRDKRTEKLAQGISNLVARRDIEQLTPSLSQLNTQLQKYTAQKSTTTLENLHHSLIGKQIMQNLTQVNSDEREQLQLKKENIIKQLQLLNEQPQGKTLTSKQQKRREKDRSYLEKQLANINSYTQLSKEQTVIKDGNIGTITDLKLSPGGMPEAWVQWSSSSVPIPEQPNCLKVVTQELNQHIREQDESIRTSQHSHRIDSSGAERIYRASTESLHQKDRRSGESIKRDRIPSSPPEANRGVDQTASTNNQSDRPNRRKDRPTLREARQGITNDVERVDVSRRRLNGSSQKLGHGSQQLRHHSQQYEQSKQRFGRVNRQNGRVQQDFRELANQARNMPLEEIVQRLGLEPDHYTPNLYKISQVYAISITEQRFYDHLAQKGGGGAIDLVMHVNDCDFKEAVEWINGNSINLTPVKQVNHSSSKQPLERQPFEPPVPDDSKWSAVRDYLVNTRGLPEPIVDRLHKNGSVYADSKQNVVFIRKSINGEVTGASLRGTYNDSKFKGLSKGTHRDAGWFALKKGTGEPELIVLTESPIDALSAAAIAQKPETTLFLSTDGAGSIPHEFLQNKLREGKQILVAYDNDEAGNHLAQKVMEQLPGSHRVTPADGKDWNEQLLRTEIKSIASKANLLLQKFGQKADLDGSLSFEGKHLRFSSTDQSISIYSKVRDKTILEMDKDKKIIVYAPNQLEKELLLKLHHHPALTQSSAPRRLSQ